ncbi:hypothetical protein RI129_007911 [Pyrocoelia pectoralis]|uniref:Uncharacterized protein n=1 Tax=Pyrocoelia pectoralis TaxID=417401 RepID=A0AAN7VEG3_9COLE
MHNGALFEGIQDTLYYLITLNKRIHFVSNNQFVNMDGSYRRLTRLVPNLSPQDVVTPVSAMIQHLKDLNFNNKIFYLGPQFCKEMFVNAGFKVKSTHTEMVEESIDSVVSQAVDDTSVGAVICDFDMNINFVKLLKAVTYLRRPEVFFFTGPTDERVMVRGTVVIGPGCFKNLLEQVSGRSSVSFAKPSKAIGDYLIKKFKIQDPSRSLYVGDSLDIDIKFGNDIGFQTLFVLTGVSKLEDIDAAKARNLVPKYFLNSLADLGVLWFHGGGVFQGIKETFYKLSTMNKKIHFVTHNIGKKEEELFKILNELVPNLTFTDIVTPTSAMIRYLKHIHFDKEIWYLGTSNGRERFVQAGFKVSEVALMEESMDALLDHGADNIEIGAVICDFDCNMSYTKLLKALAYLQREDVLFFTGSLLRQELGRNEFKWSNGRSRPGSFLNLLTQLSERDCTRFGKPSTNLGDYLIDVFDIRDTSRSLFVGDMLDIDIKFGNDIGFQTLFVSTGISKLEDIDAGKARNLVPKYFLNSLADLGHIIEEKLML